MPLPSPTYMLPAVFCLAVNKKINKKSQKAKISKIKNILIMLLWEFSREMRAGKTTFTVQSWMMKMVIVTMMLISICCMLVFMDYLFSKQPWKEDINIVSI